MPEITIVKVGTEVVDGVTVDAVWDRTAEVVYLLTACCGASAKGSGDGVVCRACYQSIPDGMGMAWTAETFAYQHECTCVAKGIRNTMLSDCPQSPLYGIGWR